MTDPETRYTGQQGCAYFGSKFSGDMDLGRKYQSRYFSPFCREDKVLLDFGFGDGTLVRELPAAKRFGVEINPTCREKIRSMNVTHGQQIDVFESSHGLADQSIDVAISNHCLEHVPDPLGTLTELNRVLKPGGDLVIVVPFDDWRQKGHRTWHPNNLDQHLFTWSPLNLGNLLSAAGFTVDTIELCSRAWSPRLFWIHRLAGDAAFEVACRILSMLKQRREVFSKSSKKT